MPPEKQYEQALLKNEKNEGTIKSNGFADAIKKTFPNLKDDLSERIISTIGEKAKGIKDVQRFFREIQKIKDIPVDQIETEISGILQSIQDIEEGEKKPLSGRNNFNQLRSGIVIKQEDIQKGDEDIQKGDEDIQKGDEDIQKGDEDIQIELLLKEQTKEKIQQAYAQTKDAQKLINLDYKNHTSEQLQTKINAFSSETKAKLEENSIDPSTYASFLLSRESINNASDTSESSKAFLKSLESLESSLGIKEAGFSREQKLNPDFLKKNPDLENFANDNEALKAFDQQLTWERLKTPQDNFNFVKTYGDEKLNALQDQISPFFDIEGNIKSLNQEEAELFKTYRGELLKLKQDLSGETAQLFKLSTTHAPIPALMNYLDKETLGNQTLADLLKGDQTNAIQIKEEQNALMGSPDKVMHIQGMVQGKPITFYYNLSTPTASLQCDDTLHFDPITNAMTLGEGRGQRTDLNITMPSVAQLSENMQKTFSPQKMQEMIAGSGDRNEYLKNLNTQIGSTLEGSFSDEKLVGSRISRHTEKNLTIQSFQQALIPNEISQKLSQEAFLNQEPATRNFFRLLDATTEKSTSSELQEMRNSLLKIEQILTQPAKIANIQDPLLKSSLQKLYDAKIKKTDFQSRNDAIISFFSFFSKQEINGAMNAQDPNFKLNINDLNTMLHFIDKSESITDKHHLQFFSPNFQEKYEQAENNDHSTQAVEAELDQAFE